MIPPEVRNAISASGINAEALDRIRLARGVVGKAGYVAGAALLALTVVAYGLGGDPDALLIVAGLVVFLFLAFLIGVLWFANKHPGIALLEGAELIQWRQMEMAAQGMPVAPPSPQIVDPEPGEKLPAPGQPDA